MPQAGRELALPPEPKYLWIERGVVPPARPILQGDVFRNLPERANAGLDLLVTHPCSMRRGARLRPRQTVVEIESIRPPDSVSDWKVTHYDFAPLMGIEEYVGGGGVAAADFRRIRSVDSGELTRERRVAAMSSDGIYMLQQRFAHYLSRAVIDLPTLVDVSEAVLVEVELQEQWVEAHSEGNESETAIAALEASFQDLLDADGRRLRAALDDRSSRPSASREIRQRIREL